MESTINTPVFQVSEFNEAINQHLSLLGEITIEGEIGRLDIKNNRLIFGSIKDSQSSVDIFSLTHLIRNLSELEPGMLVQVHGTSGLYKGSSKFRVFVNQITPQGRGSLQIALERLKAQLEAEGLFDQSRKRPLPLWPKNIGLITAKNSSAYHDLVKILNSRMGGLNLKLLPVNVQGREAVKSLLNAFKYLNSHQKEFDLVIMARGGGSLEDLAAFNTEELARAVFSCSIPIISAIGHEDNWSLTDYVADMRASTPSNAAELAVSDRHALNLQLDEQINSLKFNILNTLHFKDKFIHQAINLIKNSQKKHVQTINNSIVSITTSVKNILNLKIQQLNNLDVLLNSLDYHNVLKRGFSITTLENGKILKNSQDISQNELIITKLNIGEIKSYVR